MSSEHTDSEEMGGVRSQRGTPGGECRHSSSRERRVRVSRSGASSVRPIVGWHLALPPGNTGPGYELLEGDGSRDGRRHRCPARVSREYILHYLSPPCTYTQTSRYNSHGTSNGSPSRREHFSTSLLLAPKTLPRLRFSDGGRSPQHPKHPPEWPGSRFAVCASLALRLRGISRIQRDRGEVLRYEFSFASVAPRDEASELDRNEIVATKGRRLSRRL